MVETKIQLNNIFIHLTSSSKCNNIRRYKEKSIREEKINEGKQRDVSALIAINKMNANLSYFHISGGTKSKGTLHNNRDKEMIKLKYNKSKHKSVFRLNNIDIEECLANSKPIKLSNKQEDNNSLNNNTLITKNNTKHFVNQISNKTILIPSYNNLSTIKSSRNNDELKIEIANPYTYSKHFYQKLSHKKITPSSIQINRSKYEKISLHTFNNQKIPTDDLPFIDSIFPPNISSIHPKNNTHDAPFHLKETEIYWLRLNEIFNKGFSIIEKTFNQSIFPSQGILRDSNVISTLIALSQRIILVSKLIITDKPQKVGCYQFIFRINGIPTVVIIDDQIPCLKGTKCPVFARSSSKNVWPILLEKALAKVFGSYSALQCVSVESILNMLIRFPIITNTLPNNNTTTMDSNEKKIKEIIDSTKSNKVIIAKIDSSLINSRLLIDCKGLIYDAYYVIKGIFEEIIGGNKQTLIKIKSPVSKIQKQIKQFLITYDGKQVEPILYTRKGINDYDFNGEWSDYSNNWTEEASFKFLEYHNTDQSEGLFWMSLKDFSNYFNTFTVFNYITPLYSTHINITTKNTTIVYLLYLNKKNTINISILTNQQRVQIVLIKIRNDKKEYNDNEQNCFEIFDSNINTLTHTISSSGTYTLLLFMNEIIDDLKMNILCSSELVIREINCNEKLKHLLFKNMALDIFNRQFDGKKDINQKAKDQIIAYWPIILPRTEISFVVIFNSHTVPMDVCLKWNMTNCTFIQYSNSIDVDNLTINKRDYYVISIMNNDVQLEDSIEKKMSVINKKYDIEFEFNVILPNEKNDMISNYENKNILHSLISISEAKSTDNVYYEYVL